MLQPVSFNPAHTRTDTDVDSVTVWHNHNDDLSTQVDSFIDDDSTIWFFQGNETHAHVYMNRADLRELRNQITDALEDR